MATLPAGTSQVVARRARGDIVRSGSRRRGQFPGLVGGTYSIEALAADGSVLAEELTTVGAHAGERPVHGFATSFDDESIPAVLDWLRELRCTVVQIYDWMSEYTAPLGPGNGWRDPSGRPVSFHALRALAAGIREQGAVAHAYAPVYAADLGFAAEHPEMMLYQGDGSVERFFDMIKIANPANKQWQSHFAASYGSAADSIGFDGFHIDTYGYPALALDASGQPVDLRVAYEGFLTFVPGGPAHGPGQLQPGERRAFGGQAARRAGLSLLRGVGAQRRMAPPGGPDGPERRQGRPAGPRFVGGPADAGLDRLLPAGVGHQRPGRACSRAGP